MSASFLTEHWEWLSAPGLIGGWLGLRVGLWNWIVRQFNLNRQVTDLQGQVKERTTERDEAIKGRDDAYQMVTILRTSLEDLKASALLVRQASTLVTSDASPNPLAPSPPTSETSPPGSSPSPHRRGTPVSIPPS